MRSNQLSYAPKKAIKTVRSNQQSLQGSAKLRALRYALSSNQQSFTGSAKPHAQKKDVNGASNQQSLQGSATRPWWIAL